MNTKTHDTRQHILDIGYQLVVSKGFTAVGLSELLKTADVPKGSFYHYFKSKEQFGEAMIDGYLQSYLARLSMILNQPGLSGYECLIDYFSRWVEQTNGTCNANKCLIVKLSAEVSDLSETMRQSLAKGAEQIILAITECINRGITDNSVHVNDARIAATQLYQQWLGASLLNKLVQDQTHLELSLETSKSILKAK